MPTTRNIAFTALIKVNGRLREFNFRKRNDEVYDGDIGDERGIRYFFRALKQENGWKINGTGLPDWITSSEALIDETLQHRKD